MTTPISTAIDSSRSRPRRQSREEDGGGDDGGKARAAGAHSPAYFPKDGVLCKFFAHGACLKGEYCEFSHDWKNQANNVCTFYQKGVCSYGSRCRYDHVKVSRHQTPAISSSSNSRSHVASGSVQNIHPSGFSLSGEPKPALSSHTELLALNKAPSSPNNPVWKENYDAQIVASNITGHHPLSVSLADQPICSFAAAGSCPYGERCSQMHGDLCSICGKHCLHPYRPDEREDHIKMCEKNNKHLEALSHSQEIECSVCFDRVLSKPSPAERKFGLLSECDHPFCITCIRNWRSNSPTSGMDINSTLRACPICRKLSYFVIPSVIWYSSQEEKQEIIESYKNRLKSIDCRHFDFGNGTCPFGTSCFYRHAYRDGSLEEVALRHLDAEDGNIVIAKNIRLVDFLSRMHL